MTTHQERLADMIKSIVESGEQPQFWSTREMAATILDSDVIREIKAEAWAEGRATTRHGAPQWPSNPYREADHG